MTAAPQEIAPPEDTPDETSVPALWEAARYFLRWLYAMCGGPCDLVAEPWLTAKERRNVNFWLRPVEALVRRLLVAEAAKIAQSLPPERKNTAPKPGRPAKPRSCRASFPDPEDSTGWKVRFSLSEASVRTRIGSPVNRFPPHVRGLDMLADVLAPSARAFAAAQCRQRRLQGDDEPSLPPPETMRLKASRRAGNPWPLARRIEALTRVAANPEPHARRLARRLRKDLARLLRACRPPPRPGPGQRPPYGHESLRHASEHALRELSVFRTRLSEGTA